MLLDCLRKIVMSKADFDLQVAVVDNNSSDKSVSKIRILFHSVFLIKNSKNLGWAGGNNVGIRYALKRNADCVLLLNNDVKIDRDSIQCLVKKLYSKKNVGIVGPKTYKKDNSSIIADAGGVIDKNRYFGINRGNDEVDMGKYDGLSMVDFISGSAMLIKNDVFKKIGYFDERFFLYYEDVDFCVRARKAGFLSMFVPESVMRHEFGRTTKIGSPLHNYYTTRNHYLFVEKHAPIYTKIKELLRTPKTIIEFIRCEDKNRKIYSMLGMRDYFLRRFGERIYW